MHVKNKWLHESISSIKIVNIKRKDTKLVDFIVTLNLANSKTFDISTINGIRTVTRFRDFNTGLIVANVHAAGMRAQYRSVMQEFQKQVMDACRGLLDDFIEKLKMCIDSTQFKSIQQIQHEGYMSCDTGIFVFKQIKHQLKRSNVKYSINQYLVFSDTTITDQLATYRLPYKDPSKQELTQEQKDLVERFLSAFVTRTNMNILSWYMGATLMNVPLYHANISKMLVVSSAGGGCGKNTLFGALSSALLTDNYRDIKPEFDDVFDKTNRFGAGDLLNVRYTQYNEANFSSSDQNVHDFSGLAVSEIKSLISDGYVSRERKFADVINNKVSSMQVVLTNNFPEIDEKLTDLTRRLLSLTIKADRMEIKGRKLGLNSETEIYEFVKDNVQAFANYFASYYMNHKRQYTNTDYDAHDALESISDTAKIEAEKTKKQEEKLQNLLANDPIKGLKSLADSLCLDATKLFEYIKNNNSDDVRVCDGKLYINRAKRFFDDIELLSMRNQLLKLVHVEKKFRQNMFVFDISKCDVDNELMAIASKPHNSANIADAETSITGDQPTQVKNIKNDESVTTDNNDNESVVDYAVEQLQAANSDHKLDTLIDYIAKYARSNNPNVFIANNQLYLTTNAEFYRKLNIDISTFVDAVKSFVYQDTLLGMHVLVVKPQNSLGGDV